MNLRGILRLPAIGTVMAGLLVMGHLGRAEAQWSDSDSAQAGNFESPERFALELRIGPYEPEGISDLYSDQGPLIATEFDVLFLRIPYVGLAGVGVGIGWSRHTADARTADVPPEETQEELSFFLIPITGVAVLRVDALARQLGIPFVFTGKLGLDAIYWDSNQGDSDEADGTTVGLHWAVQVALELDFFDRSAARSLDEEWGINHAFVFFEYFGAEAEGSPAVGDRNWTAGLGFTL